MTKRDMTLGLIASMMPRRKLLADQPVVRRVQGVQLEMPRSHMLPVYARLRPTYGQNLVELAAGLKDAAPDEPLLVMDVGANIGDSALQMIARTDAHVLCVEGDPYWVRYLRRNVGSTPGVVVEEVLLAPDDADLSDASPVRVHGTTRFVTDASGERAQPVVTASTLRRRHPEFDGLRLLKSDTDGFDPVLVPAVARAWQDARPVLFFEFDPVLARVAGNDDPGRLWDDLAALGYDRLAVWDNIGDPLGQLDTQDAAEQALSLEPRPVELGYHFWDVAACHADDVAARAVLDRLVPDAFDVRGTWR
ncbi:MAG TPA: FkbM family methyltransferase [Nocardioidaceae bacterium]|nr:FkbM family methyltransferase [Nocardioidaceae bacterium]